MQFVIHLYGFIVYSVDNYTPFYGMLFPIDLYQKYIFIILLIMFIIGRYTMFFETMYSTFSLYKLTVIVVLYSNIVEL